VRRATEGAAIGIIAVGEWSLTGTPLKKPKPAGRFPVMTATCFVNPRSDALQKVGRRHQEPSSRNRDPIRRVFSAAMPTSGLHGTNRGGRAERRLPRATNGE